MTISRISLVSAVLTAFMAAGALAQSDIHYVRQGASGDGSSWASAWPDLPSTLIRGHTYYIADGNYDDYTFDDPAAGSTFITIKKATEQDHGESATWNSSYGDGQAVFDSCLKFLTPYWKFTGQKRTTQDSGHGFKIDATDADKGIRMSDSPSASHIRIEFVELAGCGDDDCAHSNDLFYITEAVEDIVIAHCYLHDAGRCPFLFRHCKGTIEYCHIARNESTSGQHAAGISSAWHTTWIVRYNTWEDVEGTSHIVFYGEYWEIYGNVFYNTTNPTTNPHLGNGSIACWGDTNDGHVHDSLIYNNTFVNLTGSNCGVSFNGASYANKAYNNLFYNCVTVDFSKVDFGWNWYYGIGKGNYQSDPYGEFHSSAPSIFSNPQAYDYRLVSGTQNGKDDLGAPYDRDMFSAVRGADGIWDRGAFEYSDEAGLEPPENVHLQY